MTREIIETADGTHTIFAAQYGVTYHSRFGALQESRHVFINAGFQSVIQQEGPISILEVGMGTGLNVLLTAIEAQRLEKKVHYCAYEPFPLAAESIEVLNYPDKIGLNWTNAFQKIHSIAWSTNESISDYVDIIKHQKNIEEIVDTNKFDLIYFDAFAPQAQPHLWEGDVAQKMLDALKPGGILVTYCAKGDYKRLLKSIGFEVETLLGPPGKREMTRARKALDN